MPIRRAQPLRGPAYTAVELVITMAIVALMSAVAIPRYARSVTRYRADLASRRIAADVSLARSNARITSAAQTVDFSTPAVGYSLPGMTDPNHPKSPYVVDLTQPPYAVTSVSASFTASGSATVVKQITFDRFGVPSVGGTVTVKSGDFTHTVSIDGVNGTVTIQ